VATNIVNVGYDSTNYFVICPEAGTKLLVDCGWPGTIGKLKGQMRRKGIKFEQVLYLLVTHFHPDHAGLTQELRNEGIKLLLMEPQVPHVGELKMHMKPDSGYVEIIVKGSLVLKPEDSRAFLKKEGIGGEIVPTPGHSPDSVSLVLDEGMAFTGDLTHPSLLTEDDTTCRDSWKRIYALGAKMVYPAHGITSYAKWDIR
jgi:glyoxylase-like metal-dependent hydrolase (beta-lactamase superfamily II)